MVALAMAASDEELVERAKRGDRSAFDELIAAYQRPIYHLALRYCGHPEDARELAQEVFVRAWLKLGTFRDGLPFRPWLYQVAARVCLNAAARPRLRTWSLEPADDDDRPLDPAGPPDDDPAAQAAGGEFAAAVQRAVAALPPPYRLVMLLRHVKQLSYPEIATACDLPLGTVKTHLHRARARLREQLAELLPDGFGEST